MNYTSTTQPVWWRKNDMMVKEKVGPSTMSIQSGPTTSNGEHSLLKTSTNCMTLKDMRSGSVQNEHNCQRSVKRQKSNTDVLKPSVSRTKPRACPFSLSRAIRSSKKEDVLSGECMENQDTSLPEDNMQQASQWCRSVRLGGSGWSAFTHRIRPLRRKIQRKESEFNSVVLSDVLQDDSVCCRTNYNEISRSRSCCGGDAAGSYSQGNSCSAESVIHDARDSTCHVSLQFNTRNHVEELEIIAPVDDNGLPTYVVKEDPMKKHVVESETKCPRAAVVRIEQPTDSGSKLCGEKCRRCSSAQTGKTQWTIQLQSVRSCLGPSMTWTSWRYWYTNDSAVDACCSVQRACRLRKSAEVEYLLSTV